jgi:hypothetical protein
VGVALGKMESERGGGNREIGEQGGVWEEQDGGDTVGGGGREKDGVEAVGGARGRRRGSVLSVHDASLSTCQSKGKIGNSESFVTQIFLTVISLNVLYSGME